MKYPILVHEFSFNKIKNGSRKVGVHLLDKKSQQVKLHDILEMHNRANGEVIECEVKGIAIFDNFKDLVEALSPQALGYDSEEEVLIRLNRMYSIDLQRELNAVAFFIAPSFVNMRRLDRGDSYRGFKSLLIRQLKNALNKLGVFLSDESVQTSPQACFHGEGSEFS